MYLAVHPLFEWWNLIFILPIVAAVLFLLATGVGELGHHDVDHDVDHDHDGPAHGHANAMASVLSLIGVGRVPLSIVLVSLCLMWSAGGLVTNFMVPGAPVLSICIATGSMLLGTRLVASGLALLVPNVQTFGVSREALVGKEATVDWTVSTSGGQVTLRDPAGMIVDQQARVELGHEPIEKGAPVVLYRYDPAEQVFFVRRR